MCGVPLLSGSLLVRLQNRIDESHRRFQLRPLSYRCLALYRNSAEHRLTHHAPMNPNFLAIPRIVPPPCSYSRRICSNSSTLALLSTRSSLGAVRPEAESTVYGFQ